MSRPARVVIDLNAARANLARVRTLAPRSRVVAIIKADAYGHGLTRMARAFADADAFGVACLEEAVALRRAGVGKRIILLEGVFDAEELSLVRQLRLDTMVHCPEQVAMLEQAPAGPPVPVWLKIDTGMHRLGVDPAQASALWQRLDECHAVADPIRLVTHFANANARGDASVERQLAVFADSTGAMSGERCIANSAGIIAVPRARAEWVRPGLMLYGVSPFADTVAVQEGLQPVMTVRSALIAVKPVRRGESVGYGCTWACPEDMPIGVVAIGYGDGYPRHCESGTPMLVNGMRAALIGRPSMDMLIVDLRNVPQARVGDPVVLWGEGLPVEEVARHAGTIPYELLCSVRVRARFEVIGEVTASPDPGTLDWEELSEPVDNGIV
ncbi:MAG: Alanine racemase, biosynthetic [Gammaproteobacteria bacterium]|nr:Alanine racemase, biosynthetic [Gammaproteobacteria bacterium]